MSEPPLSVGPGAPSVWTGEELIIWGGSTAKGEPLATGASFDPDTDKWTDLPPAPSQPRQGHVAVWSGREVLIWGGSPPESNDAYTEGLAYRPADRTWRKLAASPFAGRVEPQSVWTGKEMFLWGGLPPGVSGSPADHGVTAAYDPAADRWRRLPAAPGPGRVIARSDKEVFFFNLHRGSNGAPSARVTRLVIPAGTWGPPEDAPLPERPLPPSAQSGNCSSSSGPALAAAQIGQWAFIWTGGCEAEAGFVYSLADGTWSQTVDLPLMQNVQAVAGDKRIYLFGNVPTGVDVYQYDQGNVLIRSDHPEVDIAPMADAVWTGEELLIFNGTRGIDQPRPGAIFTPQPPFVPPSRSP